MSKYHAVKTDGYASKAEAKRAMELKLLARVGEIRELLEQVPFQLIPKQDEERAVLYIADFVYIDAKGNQVVEDVKGFKTPEYVIKRKLMRFLYGIKIREVA